MQEASPDAPSALIVLTPVVAGAAGGQVRAAQQQGQDVASWRGAALVLSLETPVASPLLPVGRLSFGQVQSVA